MNSIILILCLYALNTSANRGSGFPAKLSIANSLWYMRDPAKAPERDLRGNHSSLYWNHNLTETKGVSKQARNLDIVSTKAPEEGKRFIDYVPYYSGVTNRKVKQWQNINRPTQTAKSHRKIKTKRIPPMNNDTLTIVTAFFPMVNNLRRGLDVYFARLQRLADTKRQIMVYCPSSIAERVRNLRPNDPHWMVVNEFESVWDIPNNKHQKANFEGRQLEIFGNFSTFYHIFGDIPNREGYSVPFLSAVYNSKAYVTYDAVMRNPFGSSMWAWQDCGIIAEAFDGPSTEMLINTWSQNEKMMRAVKYAGDEGVVIGQTTELKPEDHACWTQVEHQWQCYGFIANFYVGSTLGMLNYSMRFMQTVDESDANGFYIGREEYILPRLAVRYPGSLMGARTLIPEGYDEVVKGLYASYMHWVMRKVTSIPFLLMTSMSGIGGDGFKLTLQDPLRDYCKNRTAKATQID